jgi:peptidoglycan hydrolase-like protein with peptidoglycan-binding domain
MGRCTKAGSDVTTAATEADCVKAGGTWTTSTEGTTTPGASGTTTDDSGSTSTDQSTGTTPGAEGTTTDQPSGTTTTPSDSGTTPTPSDSGTTTTPSDASGSTTPSGTDQAGATPSAASSSAASGGSRDVMDVQRALSTQGHQLSVDGIMGPKTRDALRKYQQEQGLEATGELDAETARRLNVAH